MELEDPCVSKLRWQQNGAADLDEHKRQGKGRQLGAAPVLALKLFHGAVPIAGHQGSIGGLLVRQLLCRGTRTLSQARGHRFWCV